MSDKMMGYEKRKVTIDLFKHIATISVGIIALIASFLQKFIGLEQGKSFVIFAVLALFSAVICSVIACITLLQYIEKVPYLSPPHIQLRVCTMITFMGFFGGVGALVWLIIKNLA